MWTIRGLVYNECDMKRLSRNSQKESPLSSRKKKRWRQRGGFLRESHQHYRGLPVPDVAPDTGWALRALTDSRVEKGDFSSCGVHTEYKTPQRG